MAKSRPRDTWDLRISVFSKVIMDYIECSTYTFSNNVQAHQPVSVKLSQCVFLNIFEGHQFFFYGATDTLVLDYW